MGLPRWAELHQIRKGRRENEWLNKLIKANPWMKDEDMPFKTTPEDVTHMFTYHPPKEEQIPKYTELRKEAEKFAQTILRLTPSCPDQTVAIRKVREAVMVANAAIALEK
jgi:hypothetical protein